MVSSRTVQSAKEAITAINKKSESYGDTSKFEFATGVKFRFNDPIEKYLYVDPNKDVITPKQQPQVHIGIILIFKIVLYIMKLFVLCLLFKI